MRKGQYNASLSIIYLEKSKAYAKYNGYKYIMVESPSLSSLPKYLKPIYYIYYIYYIYRENQGLSCYSPVKLRYMLLENKC